MLVRFITCLSLLVAVAIQKDGSLFGYAVHDYGSSQEQEEPSVRFEDEAIVVNTTSIASDIKGYAGSIPMEIRIIDGKISAITLLDNNETPSFVGRASEAVLPAWTGMALDDVEAATVDAVSGATMSSDAISATVRGGVAHAGTVIGERNMASAGGDDPEFDWSVRSVVALIVVLAGMSVPLFYRGKGYRYVQLVANVLVLGFWSGTFISYSLLVGYLANGMNVVRLVIPALLIVAAFVYPYFGKKSHYCNWLCPLGSLQELAGKTTGYKLHFSSRTAKYLDAFRTALWWVLMLVMCAGIWFDWMDYELFSAFLFRQAAWGVVAAALAFVCLSFVVYRPYCRYVCPTGCLLQITQNSDKK